MSGYSEALAVSQHEGVACAACHAADPVGRLLLGRRMLTTMLPAAMAGSPEVTGMGQGTGDAGCQSCHAEGLDGTTDNNGIRINHSPCATGRTCVDCHSRVAHGDATRATTTYVMEDCVLCHQQVEAPAACDVCHSSHSERERLEQGPWQVTHGEQWAQTHGMGELDSCAVCHPSDYCVRCHGVPLPHPASFGQTHGESAKQDVAGCYACHDPELVCVDCHGMPLPHPEGFLAEHSSLASSVNDEDCVGCHDVTQCLDCHIRHVHPGNAVKAGEGG